MSIKICKGKFISVEEGLPLKNYPALLAIFELLIVKFIILRLFLIKQPDERVLLKAAI